MHILKWYFFIYSCLSAVSLQALDTRQTYTRQTSTTQAPTALSWASMGNYASGWYHAAMSSIGSGFGIPKKINTMLTQYENNLLIKTAQSPNDNADSITSTIMVGADLKYADAQGLTALHHAALKGNVRIVEALLKAGAPIDAQVAPTAKKYAGMTPLALALSRTPAESARRFRENPYTDIVFLLLDKGADLTVQDAGGRTALFWVKNKPVLLKELQNIQEVRDYNKKLEAAHG